MVLGLPQQDRIRTYPFFPSYARMSSPISSHSLTGADVDLFPRFFHVFLQFFHIFSDLFSSTPGELRHFRQDLWSSLETSDASVVFFDSKRLAQAMGISIVMGVPKMVGFCHRKSQ